ncbi:dihydrofolate reductase family protein [Chitinophaga sp. Hz27]|uniref:dihydrofolate reductase family protein n=1 Tax=Chitinophaga sp. Hz27 TaxID=3347169 RepID=UPI0035E00DD6
MRVSLIANIAANGKVLLSENIRYQAPQTAMGIFMEVAARAGNLVLGKKTFEMLQQVIGNVKAAFPGIELLLIAGSSIPDTGVHVVGSHEEAISYLTAKGYQEIAVGGGTITYNAFLDNDLVTDIYFNIHPVIVGNGGVLGADNELATRFKLVSSKEIGDNIVQLHYDKA